MTNTNYKIKVKGTTSWLTIGESHYFSSKESAIEALDKFKLNPRMINDNMSDESVEYWKSKEYVIIKITTTYDEVVV